jgi:hypothetical protein
VHLVTVSEYSIFFNPIIFMIYCDLGGLSGGPGTNGLPGFPGPKGLPGTLIRLAI